MKFRAGKTWKNKIYIKISSENVDYVWRVSCEQITCNIRTVWLYKFVFIGLNKEDVTIRCKTN
jgi:hypothetical protein